MQKLTLTVFLIVWGFCHLAQAAGNCEDALSDKTYNCASSTGFEDQSFTWFFEDQSDMSVKGDMQMLQGGSVLYSCNCLVGGKPYNPAKGKNAKIKSAESSLRFACMRADGGEIYFGKVDAQGKKIKANYSANNSHLAQGISAVVRCVPGL